MPDLFGAPSTNKTGQWKPEPDHRGTFSLLSTCLVTMSLCVWSALHLNLATNKALAAQILRKTTWLVLGLLAPELVAFTAFQQRREALSICNAIRQLQGHAPIETTVQKILRLLPRKYPKTPCIEANHEMTDLEPNQDASTREPWTLTHGFYAVMGGFAVDTSEGEEVWLPNGSHRATFTPSGLRFLARRELRFLPNISKEDIEDKSKANQLAKTVICIQAVWFCVQCIARLVSKLSISLLELNTFAHAICTLLIYILWWDKPLDIEQPTKIRSKEAYPLCALMSFMNGDVGYPWETVDLGANDELKIMFSETPGVKASNTGGDGGITICDQQQHRNMQISFSIGHDYLNKLAFPFPGTFQLCLNRQQDRYWQLVSEAFALYPGPPDGGWKVEYYARSPGTSVVPWVGRIRTRWQHSKDEKRPAFIARSRNWSDFNSDTDVDLLTYMVGFSVAGLLYGGLHMLAWTAPFHTRTQMILWRMSSLSLVVSGPAILAGSRLLIMLVALDFGFLKYPMVFIVSLLIFCFVIFYIFVRVYLIVECFLSLTHSPDSVYSVVPWSQYFPHIT